MCFEGLSSREATLSSCSGNFTLTLRLRNFPLFFFGRKNFFRISFAFPQKQAREKKLFRKTFLKGAEGKNLKNYEKGKFVFEKLNSGWDL